MIALILLKKIVSLFLILIMGVVIVRLKLLKPEQSKGLSVVNLYLVMPCMILSAFQVDATAEVMSGLLLALIAAVIIHIGLIILSIPAGRLLKLDPVESTSLIYSNAAALIVPLITAMLGKEWIIYTSAFVSVQLILLWTHAKSTICGETGMDIRKIVTNINMIAIAIGIVMFATGIRFPGPVQDAVDSVSDMMGPLGMLITGMLIGSMDLKKLLSYKRLLMIVPLRLIAVPLIVLTFFKVSGLAGLAENGETILLISLLATMTPSANTVTMMAQVYGGDAEYASAINVATTIFCIITMPVMVMLYQM